MEQLIGKTITAATQMKREDTDDEGFLRLVFSDGSSCVIVSDYIEEWTGRSKNEYPTDISVVGAVAGLIPLEDGDTK